MKQTEAEKRIKHLERLRQARIGRHVVKKLEGWEIAGTYRSATSDSVHTVERNGDQYRCTCQGFRIHKRGFCKHTELARQGIIG